MKPSLVVLAFIAIAWFQLGKIDQRLPQVGTPRVLFWVMFALLFLFTIGYVVVSQ